MTTDADDLARFMQAHPPYCAFPERWPVQGEMVVRVGLAAELPPLAVRSSILSIVFDLHDEVLYLHPERDGGNISQVLVGGRPQAGETCAEAVVREVGEETGWVIAPLRVVGYRHFHQTGPRAADSDRQHPDFVQAVFVSRALRHDPGLVIAADLLPGRMIPFARAQALIVPEQVRLLRAAHDALTG